tara:strand:+ start:1242 stop:1424 length:183 start_codon:yes stop_codon:yes gene_type:complete
MNSESKFELDQVTRPATSGELNSWRRGFTPQAEIWNGRMAMIGLAIGLSILVLTNYFVGS